GARSAGRSVGSSNTTSALAAIQVDEHRTRNEHDRQRRETEQPDEEEFEGDEIHVPSLGHPGLAARDYPGMSATTPKTAEITPITSVAPPAVSATRSMKPLARPSHSCTAKVRTMQPPSPTVIQAIRPSAGASRPTA